jgi:hypothetical protein
MATEVATLTFKADTADLDRAEKALDGVAASGKRAQSSTDNFSKATEQSGKSMKNMRGIAGQLGFQVQDIAVQLQSGTNAMIVFGQQGSQIAGAFGPGGAIVGAVIAVGAAIGTALVAHFGNGTQSAKDLRAEIEELTEDFDKLGDAARTVYIRELAAQMAEAEEQIQNTTEALKEANNALRDPAALEAANMLNPYVDMLVEARVKQQDLAKAEEDQIAVLEALKEKYDLIIGAKKEEDKDATRRIEDVKRYVERMEEQAETIGLNTIELARYKAAQMGANEAQTQSILLSARRVEQYKAEQEAIKQAEAQKKKEAALAAAEARATSDDQKRLDQKVQQIINAEARKAEAEQAATDQRAVQIAESLMSEEEQISLSYERRSQIILDSTLLTGQQVNEAMAALELERQDKLRAIKDKSAAEDRERAAQTTTQLLAFEDMLMKGKSEKQKTAYRLAVNLASAEKRQNAAKIVSDSYAAAMGAYKALAGIPIIGPALGAGAAALILGAGVSFAAKSLTGRALGGQVRDGESYVVGERGPEVLTMNGGGGRIIPNEKLRGGGGKTVNQQANVTFQISTVDAQGFDELLDSSRGQIVNMINTALNESGKGALA